MKKLVTLCIYVLVLASCTGRDTVYRNHQDTYCDNNLIFLPDQDRGERELSPDLLVSSDARDKGLTPAHCHFQQHAGAIEPETLERYVEGKDNPAHRFNLSFVELSEDGERRLGGRQMDTLIESLRENRARGKRNHVIMFVHGWRHDADLDNANVRTFRTLLNYSSSFVRERDENAVVTGVYVGWRGRQFAERTTRGPTENTISSIGAVWTVWSRKKMSEKLSEHLFDIMEEISEELEIASPSDARKRNSFMVVGHSFGGNMIAKAVKTPIKDALDGHTPGSEFALDFADLIVLINPAAEASKMNELQRKIREKAGLPDYRPEGYNTSVNRQTFETLFPITQPPRYISLTSTAGWSRAENPDNRRPSYDWATGLLFPLAQLVTGKSGEHREAIGHHHANYVIQKLDAEELRDRDPTEHRRPIIDGPEVGASHDMVAIHAAGIRTGFANAEVPGFSACPRPNRQWLYEARQRKIAHNNPFGRSWDTGFRQSGELASLLSWNRPATGADSNTPPVVVQIRHALAIPPSAADRRNAGQIEIEGTFRSVVPANSPIWITRSFDNVITNHGGFQNYAMWCALSQIVLDDVAAKPD